MSYDKTPWRETGIKLNFSFCHVIYLAGSFGLKFQICPMWLQLFDVAENKGDQLHRPWAHWDKSGALNRIWTGTVFPHLRARRRESMGNYDTKENRSAETWAHNPGLLFSWGHLYTRYVLSKLRCFVQLHTALEVLGTNVDERFIKKKGLDRDPRFSIGTQRIILSGEATKSKLLSQSF